MTNILIIGKNGQIANAIIENFKLEKTGFNILVKNSSELDFSNSTTLQENLKNISTSIDLIINCAGYTNVDKAEEEQELCNQINHQAVKILAEFCKEKNILLVHYSTDYVFDGSGDKPFDEDNQENLKPLNYYGKTKLLSEQALQNSGCNYVIFRISWIYDKRPTSKNFVNTIKRLALEKEEISVVDDQIGSPTSAEFVASNTIRFIKKITLKNGDENTGENSIKFDKNLINQIYHLNNGELVSRYQQAEQIFTYLKRSRVIIKLKKIVAIKSDLQHFSSVKKPLNCQLNNEKINKILNLNSQLQKKYIAVFAHYDKHNIVDDYVLYYLENLKLIADKIIFVSDNNLPEIEQNKLQNLCHKIIAKKHGEYDFGSYKRGLEEAYQYSQDYDAIIIANDSCYGPIRPLNNIFKTMEYSDCDFWGLTVNQEQYLPHLQSYFLVFNKKIINSEIFKNFFRKVKREDNKQNIIENYEIALTPAFIDAGFKMDSFIKKIFERNPTLEFDLFTFLMKNDFPFFKVYFINKKTSNKRAVFKDCLKNQTLIVLVKNHLKRIGKNRFFGIKLPNKFSKACQDSRIKFRHGFYK
jgi:dTDP-4-dehydrorhamnose reductase